MLMTSAPFEDPEAGWQVFHFGVPLNSEGVSLLDDWQVHGMRATGSQTVALDNVFVPEAAIGVRRPRGQFHEIFSTIATAALPLVMGVYLGIAERAADLALGMAKPNAQSPEVQWAIGEMRSHLAVARLCWERAVAVANELDFTPTLDVADEALTMKSRVAEHTRKTVEAAMEATGGRGFFRRNGLEQLLRDVRAGHYHPLPVKEQLRFSGRLALGLEPVEPPRVD
jgi:acyl-CoA dehydrogenase